MNFENSKTSEHTDYHSILSIKWTWNENINILLYQILVFIIHGKYKKSHMKMLNLKYYLRHRTNDLN